jgi:hypothetical protein
MTTHYTATLPSWTIPAAVSNAPLILETIEAAGMWLASYIKGAGTIDVRVAFDGAIETVTGGSFSSTWAGPATALDGRGHTLATFSTADELRSGVDANGADPDALVTIGLTNLNAYYWFDTTIASTDDIPRDKTDGFRVMLHELLHAVGFNGWLAHAPGPYDGAAVSVFDTLVRRLDGRSYFMGEQAQKAFGGPVPLTDVHLGDKASIAAGQLTGEQSLMSIDYVPNGNRISLDPVVIGILRDLGFDVRDTQARLVGTAANDHSVTLGTAWAGHDITQTLDLTWLGTKDGSDYSYLLEDVERLYFTDAAVAFDVGAGEVAGSVYRLYQAAFDRKPDAAGVGYWIGEMDGGKSLQTVAAEFIRSAEFQALYGASLAIESFVGSLYDNVLHRAPDAAGFTYWADSLRAAGDTANARANVLAAFSESPENQAQVIGVIGDGFEYQPFA